jgi:hypothetical protein
MEGEGMESNVNVLVITAALFFVIGGGVQMASASPRLARAAQTQENKTGPTGTDNKTSPAADCSLLTPTMLEKVLGDSFRADSPEKALPMYGGASGSSCTYRSRGGVRVDFSVYAETTAAKAKQDFDKYAVAADDSRGKPSIGDSAYWVEPTKQTLVIYVLKGKVHFSISVHFNIKTTTADEKPLKDLATAVAAGI